MKRIQKIEFWYQNVKDNLKNKMWSTEKRFSTIKKIIGWTLNQWKTDVINGKKSSFDEQN